MKAPAQLSLYWFNGCPWCERVRAAIADLELDVDERNIRADPTHADALHGATGRGKVPVLRIDSQGGTEWLSESADIVQRLYSDYGPDRPQAFFASKLPQRLGLALGGGLLLATPWVPEQAQQWTLLAAAITWLAGTRAPLLRKLF